jgi:hypothetical protein
MPANRFFAGVNANGSATLLGIVTAQKGSGAPVTDKRGRNIGQAVKQADLSSITASVTDTTTAPETVTYTSPLTISVVMFDVIQYGGLWWIDPVTGYNFLTELPPAAFPVRDRNYRCVIQFASTNGLDVGIAEWILSA